MINLRTEKKNALMDGLKPSRYQGQEQHRFEYRSETSENINSRLQSNYVHILQLLKERKDLLLKKAELMQKDNENKLDSISRARSQDLKNEARMLRDDSIMNLLQNADKLNSTKNLLQRIASQDINNFEIAEKNKGKRYWDKYKDSDSEIQVKNKKYLGVIADLEKITEKERGLFQEIQRFEAQIIQVLTKKERDYLKRADQLNDEIQRRKNILKDNKSVKDRKKAQLVDLLSSLLDTIKFHEDITIARHREVGELFNGDDSKQGLQQFFSSLQIVIQHKIEDHRVPENSLKDLSSLVSNYQIFIDELSKLRENQGKIFEDLSESYRRNIKIRLLEKAYLTGLSTHKADLMELIKKCQHYRKLLEALSEDRSRVNKELTKVNQLNSFFYGQYKAISNESTRKKDLKVELDTILAEQNELEKTQKKRRNFQYELGNLQLRKKAIQREMEDCASKGNLNEYKVKVKDLQKVDRQMLQLRQIGNGDNVRLIENRLLSNLQILNQKYMDLIKDIIVEERQMNYTVYLNKLSKRLTLV